MKKYLCSLMLTALSSMLLVSCSGDDSPDQPVTIQFGLETPNKMLAISTTEALVSKLYGTTIAIIDLDENVMKGTIDIGTETKAMTLNGTTAYVITDSTGFAVINTTTKTVTDRVTIGDYPASIIADSVRNQIVLLSQGSYFRGTTAKIHFINMTSLKATDSIDLGEFASSLIDAGSSAYVLFGDRVGVLNFNAKAITTPSLIAKSFSGGYFDAESNEAVLGTAKDYQTIDTVSVYHAVSGDFKRSFVAGVAAIHFAKYSDGSTKKLFVLNEGAWGANNATLTSYNYNSGEVKNDLATELGDVGNDIMVMNGNIYVLLNGSRKIVVLDPSTVQ